MKNAAVSVLILTVGLVAGFAIHGSTTPATPSFRPGDELQSVDPDYVRMLSFTSSGSTVTAQRSVMGTPFDVVMTYADGKASAHCRLSKDLMGRLAPFTRITAKRGLSVDEREAQFPVHVGNLLLQSFSTEPDAPIMVFTNAAENSVAFISEHYIAEVAVPLSAVRDLDMKCP